MLRRGSLPPHIGGIYGFTLAHTSVPDAANGNHPWRIARAGFWAATWIGADSRFDAGAAEPHSAVDTRAVGIVGLR